MHAEPVLIAEDGDSVKRQFVSLVYLSTLAHATSLVWSGRKCNCQVIILTVLKICRRQGR
jgi:hypothetical protein